MNIRFYLLDVRVCVERECARVCSRVSTIRAPKSRSESN